jgi:2-polyprenyl-6-methoxyphenol hydroxylase-like FAD-dependent oxidoreductase
MTYDVIVVGSRVAGAACAMLLAREGLRVLALDRAGFPSDTLSTHAIEVPGVARLDRWGLLDRLDAAKTPAVSSVRLAVDGVELSGSFPAVDGVGAVYSPRRTVLDRLLVEAARDAGAEVREHIHVQDVIRDGDRVVGIRGRLRAGAPFVEHAGLVIGADGKNSLVARAVAAADERHRAPITIAAYSYWSGVPLERGELYQRRGLAVAAFPTNDDASIVYLAAPATDLAAFRRDTEGEFLRRLDRCSDLGARVRDGLRVERLRLTPDLPNRVRIPYGPGWALAGDAGLVMDPVSAQGISQAFRDADLLASAVVRARDDHRPLDAHLADYHRARNRSALPVYDFTLGLARLRPGARSRRLVAAIADRPDEVERFLGAFAGITSPAQYFSARNLVRVLARRRVRQPR